MVKKDCYHCSYIRPKKDNLCSIIKQKIVDIHNHCCNHFSVDICIQRREELMMAEQSDDEGSSYRFFNFFFSRPVFS